MRRFQPVPPRVGVCTLDPRRVAPLAACMKSCGPDHPADAWRHGCIHPETVAYSCGRVARPGGPNEHDHDPEEIVLCRRVAVAAAAVCRGLVVNASEGRSSFAPFFLTA